MVELDDSRHRGIALHDAAPRGLAGIASITAATQRNGTDGLSRSISYRTVRTALLGQPNQQSPVPFWNGHTRSVSGNRRLLYRCESPNHESGIAYRIGLRLSRCRRIPSIPRA